MRVPWFRHSAGNKQACNSIELCVNDNRDAMRCGAATAARTILIASGAREREIDIRLATGNQIGKRSPRSAGHRPAERSVAGVEEEITVARGADERHIG